MNKTNSIDIFNPLAIGYSKVTWKRLVRFVDNENVCIETLPLHPSQEDIDSSELLGEQGYFGEQYVVVDRSDTELTRAAQKACPSYCTIDCAVYRIEGVPFDNPDSIHHIGDVDDLIEAQNVVKNLTSKSGRYGRIWEINSCHIPYVDYQILAGAYMHGNTYADCLFEVFPFPVNEIPCVGIKLIGAPWNDETVKLNLDITYQDLYNRCLDLEGLSESFVELLHLAGKTDTRVLVLDPQAARIEGLPLYEHK